MAKWWQRRSKKEREADAVPGFTIGGNTGLSITRNRQYQEDAVGPWRGPTSRYSMATSEDIDAMLMTGEWELAGRDDDGTLVIRRK